MTQRYYRCASNPVQPPAPQVFGRLECWFRGTYNEVEQTRYYCVGTGGLASTSNVPADDPCSMNCTDYQACTASSSHGANRSITTTSTYCGTGSPPADAWTANRTYCNGGHNDTRTVCVGTGGFASDPGNQPCTTCSATERLVGGVCEPCPWYYRCNGNNRVRTRWCNSGNPPADATTANFQSCVGGTTVTTNTCVPPGGSAPVDDPCAPTQGIEHYCDVNGVAQTRPSGSSQDVDNRDSAADCGSDQTLNSDSCCVADTSTQTATETYCDSGGNARTRPISGSRDVNNLDSASDCTSRQILNSDSCCAAQGTETYCDSNGNARTRPSGSLQDVDNRPSSCSSGQLLNSNNCCVAGGTETYCVGGDARERPSGTSQDVNNLDSAADCEAGEELNSDSCCEPCTQSIKPYCNRGQDWVWRNCSWESQTVNQPACYNSGGVTYEYDNWSSTSCIYTSPSPTNDPKPASNACGSATFSTASCGWSGLPIVPTQPTGCPGVGYAWASLDSSTCTYGSVTVSQPSCNAGEEAYWEDDDCSWTCVIETPDCPEPTSPLPACPTPGESWWWSTSSCSWEAVNRPKPNTNRGQVAVWESWCEWSVLNEQLNPTPLQ